MKQARIVLADDHNLLLEAFKLMLSQHFEVVATFANGQELLEGAPEINPDVIVLDIGMPILNGLIAGQRLKQILPNVKLIYVTMNEDPDLAAEAFRQGASGYLLKKSAASELVNAIKEAMLGRSYVTPLLTEGVFGSFIQNSQRGTPQRDLTVRQKEVLQLLAEGRTMKEVAYLLRVAPRTVAFHKYSMMRLLKLRSSAELIRFAMRSSIVEA